MEGGQYCWGEFFGLGKQLCSTIRKLVFTKFKIIKQISA